MARSKRREVERPMIESRPKPVEQLVQIQVDRREAISKLGGLLAAGLGLATTACNPFASGDDREEALLEWHSFFQGNFRLMTENERDETVTKARAALRAEKWQTDRGFSGRAEGQRTVRIRLQYLEVSRLHGLRTRLASPKTIRTGVRTCSTSGSTNTRKAR